MRGWIFFVLALLAPAAVAGVGTWKNYTSMKNVTSLARSGDTYWAATSGGLFSWNSSTNSYQRFTNADGLKDLDLTALAIDGTGNVWTGTSGGWLFVYSPSTGSLRTIPDIAATSQVNKRINALTISGDTVLVCTDFGLSLFRISRFEFGDTYSHFGNISVSTRLSVRGATIYDGKLWASITDGSAVNRIAFANLSNPNLLPPSSWTLLTAGDGSGSPKDLAISNGVLYLGTSSGLYDFAGGVWNSISTFAGTKINALAAASGKLAVGTSSSRVYLLTDPSSVPATFGTATPWTIEGLTFSAQSDPVVGSMGGGILVNGPAWTSYMPNGPNSNRFVNVVVDQRGVVWGCSGPASGEGFYRFDGTSWKSFTTSNSALSVNEVHRLSLGCDNSVWASTWGGGIAEVPAGADNIDSSHMYGANVGMVGLINSKTGKPDYLVTGNVACDGRGNLWTTILNPLNSNGIAVRPQGKPWTFLPLYLKDSGAKPGYLNWSSVDRSLAIDAYDNVWIVVDDPSYKSLVSLRNGGRIDSVVAVTLTKDNGLPSNEIKTIVVDRDNNIWVGTDKGIGIILDPLNPLRKDGVAAYKPLPGLVINTIAVDPLNQKWIGTTEGVIVLSPDGTQQIASYTVETTNGQLMDNNVESIAVDPATGTVYFGTEKGMASLTSAAAAPKLSFDEIKVYPNPYHVPNDKPLTIDGLVENSSIKILRIDGTVIRDLKTPGGRIGFWDGKDEAGHDVASGIYLIAAYSEDGSKVANGKVAVLKR